MATGIYLGLNERARKIKELYIGVNGKARQIQAGYIGVNGVAKKFYERLNTWAVYSVIEEYVEIQGTWSHGGWGQRSGAFFSDYSLDKTSGIFKMKNEIFPSSVSVESGWCVINTSTWRPTNNDEGDYIAVVSGKLIFNGNSAYTALSISNGSATCSSSLTSKKGTFLYNTSAKPGTYPNNGISGNYWYVLVS